jgi:hypothetical protein
MGILESVMVDRIRPDITSQAMKMEHRSVVIPWSLENKNRILTKLSILY